MNFGAVGINVDFLKIWMVERGKVVGAIKDRGRRKMLSKYV